MEAFRGDIFISSRQNERSKDSKWKITLVLILLGVITWILTILAPRHSQIVERVYSSTLYPNIAKSIGLVSNIVPISLAEISLLMIIVIIITIIVLSILKPKIIINNLTHIFHWSVRLLAIIYILFYFLWGFNYYRMDYMAIAGMNKETGSIQELEELSLQIIQDLNIVRANLIENDEGVFIIEESFCELSKQAQEGFNNFMVGPLALDGKYAQAKPVVLSKWMSYTGIMGIFIPFTSEPSINADIPYHNLLSTISHEMAHQRGFAKEEEANFIAYKASINNPDERFQYSGYYLAMQHLMNEIFKVDQEIYNTLYSKLSDAVKRDMAYGREYWESKEGKAEEIVTTMNDNYLKANNQEQGVLSYNGVVKLLLSEYKSLKESIE